MALLTSISSANRVVEQGGTYLYNVEPAISDSSVKTTQEGQGQSAVIYDEIVVRQWRAEVTYSKRYRYVGLDGSVVDSLCDQIRNYYTHDFDRWAVGVKTFTVNNTPIPMYCYVKTKGLAPTVCASVTPVHVEGAMWEIEVDVNVTVEHYSEPVGPTSGTSANVPNATTLRNLVSSIAGFPLDYPPPSNNNNNNNGSAG